MTEQQRNRRDVGDEVREGIRAGLGILSAVKDAVEETVQEMLDRGELSQDRARETVRSTMDRAQAAFEDARVRFDFVPRKEFEALKAEVADLRARLARHETTHGGTGSTTAGGPRVDATPGGEAGTGPTGTSPTGTDPAGGGETGSGSPGPDIPLSEG